MRNDFYFNEEMQGGKLKVKIEQAREFLNFLEHKTDRRLVCKAKRMLEIQEALESVREKLEIRN
ncbi:MAG: hypothetical protein WC438_03930 [Candidatus Pacearchaeota archaeon]